MLMPSFRLPPPPPPALPLPHHQPLPPSVVKHRGDVIPEISCAKKPKSLDEAIAYQLEYQHYHTTLMYAHCAQQQRVAAVAAAAAANQMGTFRPWPQPKSTFQHSYNAVTAASLSTLPYLTQEPPILQNPERVVRSSDRERFERSYQPNVALAPRKAFATLERQEKDHTKEGAGERIGQEFDFDRNRGRDIEKDERVKGKSLNSVWDMSERQGLFIRDFELQKKQHFQTQSHAMDLNEADIQIKQERASTPFERETMTASPATQISNQQDDLSQLSNGSGQGHQELLDAAEEEITVPIMISPLALNRNGTSLGCGGHRQVSLSTSSSSASSTPPQQPAHYASVNYGHNRQEANCSGDGVQGLQSQQHLQQNQHKTHSVISQQQYLRQSPSPQSTTAAIHTTCNSLNTFSPRDYSMVVNESSSSGGQRSISPLPNYQQHNQMLHSDGVQTIIATVNHHRKLLTPAHPTLSVANVASNYGLNSAVVSTAASASTNGHSHINRSEQVTARIRISKNLLNPSKCRLYSTATLTSPVIQTTLTEDHYAKQKYNNNSSISTQLSMNGRVQSLPQTMPSDMSMEVGGLNLSTNISFAPSVSPGVVTSSTMASSTNIHKYIASPFSAIHQPLMTGHHACDGQKSGYHYSLYTRQHSHSPHNTDAMKPRSSSPEAGGLPILTKSRGPLSTNEGENRPCTFEMSDLDVQDEDRLIDAAEIDTNQQQHIMTMTWELALEALRDSKPRERGKLLNLLQRLLGEHQQYRMQNQQLKQLLEKRNEQINKLHIDLQQCRQQMNKNPQCEQQLAKRKCTGHGRKKLTQEDNDGRNILPLNNSNNDNNLITDDVDDNNNTDHNEEDDNTHANDTVDEMNRGFGQRECEHAEREITTSCNGESEIEKRLDSPAACQSKKRPDFEQDAGDALRDVEGNAKTDNLHITHIKREHNDTLSEEDQKLRSPEMDSGSLLERDAYYNSKEKNRATNALIIHGTMKDIRENREPFSNKASQRSHPYNTPERMRHDRHSHPSSRKYKSTRGEGTDDDNIGNSKISQYHPNHKTKVEAKDDNENSVNQEKEHQRLTDEFKTGSLKINNKLQYQPQHQQHHRYNIKKIIETESNTAVNSDYNDKATTIPNEQEVKARHQNNADSSSDNAEGRKSSSPIQRRCKRLTTRRLRNNNTRNSESRGSSSRSSSCQNFNSSTSSEAPNGDWSGETAGSSRSQQISSNHTSAVVVNPNQDALKASSKQTPLVSSPERVQIKQEEGL